MQAQAATQMQVVRDQLEAEGQMFLLQAKNPMVLTMKLFMKEFAIACIPQTKIKKKDAEGKPIENLFLMHWSLRAVYTGVVAEDEQGEATKTKKSCVVFDTYKLKHPKKQGAYIFKVSVTPRNDVFSPKAKEECRFEAKVLKAKERKIKVGDVVNLIRDEKLHQYVPDEYGSGCLKWTKTVLDHIVAKGWVAKNTATKFDKHVKTLQDKHLEEYWVPDDNGTFEK
ncbi:hypothetical protein DFH11DRAFT_1548113 [Phellopilus nigrolimitatus]|nr:hypothetical protein DFH11DRAFT_1548113 [Phellopilus nigrolimitatus]